MKPLLKIIVILSLLVGCSLSAETVTNSTANEREIIKEFQKRNVALLKIFNSHPTDWDAYELAVRAKIKDFPTLCSRDISGNAYGDMMTLMWHYERRNPDKTRALARKVIDSSAPEHFKLCAKGYLKRRDALGKPLVIRFTALDGREADSTKMRGKVVLVDFWSTTCPGCIRDLPKLKAAYDKFHTQGFEVIGVSCDTDKKVLQRFVRRIPWLQYFEAPQRDENKLVQEFGIYGIPHMMFLDKKGCLREDNVETASDFEVQIARLLAE